MGFASPLSLYAELLAGVMTAGARDPILSHEGILRIIKTVHPKRSVSQLVL